MTSGSEAMTCPRCAQRLQRVARRPFTVWSCRACDGCAATVATLRQGIRHDVIRQAWQHAIGAQRNGTLRCPGCRVLMDAVATDGPEIDLCRTCQLMWFDAHELAELPPRPQAEIRAEAWQAELKRMQRRREDSDYYSALILRRPMRIVR
jgi:Zn-finger nucleic acid-binding protein